MHMKIPTSELNEWIAMFPSDEPNPPAKNWVHVTVGELDTYVGDKLYVISLNSKSPQSMDELNRTKEISEEFIIKYLRREGFIENEYLYVGLQDIKLSEMENL
jgi:hypothetical protein